VELAQRLEKVFIGFMSTMTTVNLKHMAADQGSIWPNTRALGHDFAKKHIQNWCAWMDQLLSLHRSYFVYRQATPAQLKDHKTALMEALRYGLAINTVIAEPDYNEPDLTERLQVRIRQLQDAHDTFDDATLSDKQAEEVLQRVFPE